MSRRTGQGGGRGAPNERIPRRILMTADTVGGVWTYAVELARALAQHDIAVHLATMGNEPCDAQREEAASIGNLTLHESTFKLEWMAEPWPDVQDAGRWLLELSSEIDPDLVHLNGYAHASLPFRAPSLVVAHSCVYSWFDAVYRFEPPQETWSRYQREVSRGLVNADAVTAPTRAMMESLRRHYGTFAAAPVVYNARRDCDFPPAEKKPFVLAAGRVWDEAKNIRAVAEAARQISWEVRVAGDASHPDGGTAHFDGVTMLGRLTQAQLAHEYGQASIFCLPARYEPFGLCALEAALAGCALILGDIPSLREVWQEAAVYVQPDDQAGLARALSSLIDDEAKRARMSRMARDRALTYSHERMAAGYLQIYDSLIRRDRLRTRSLIRRQRMQKSLAP